MKTQRFIITLLALTFAFAPQSLRTASAGRKEGSKGQKYHAELISPKAGEVLVPGQVVRIEWTSVLPDMDLSLCETELRLSLDGGTTFTWVTGERDPLEKHFDWTVPNTPTNWAVLDIHFGCLGYYPETVSLQLQSAFVISAQLN
jgi:hypothetical protein